VARVVVDVMLKPEILDPQGQAVANALPRLGVDEVSSVRVGRRIELEFDGTPDLAKVNQLADRLLANPVIEDYTVTVDGKPVPATPDPAAPAAAPAPALAPAEATGAPAEPAEAAPAPAEPAAPTPAPAVRASVPVPSASAPPAAGPAQEGADRAAPAAPAPAEEESS